MFHFYYCSCNQTKISPFSLAVHSRLYVHLQFRKNHFFIFLISVNRLGFTEGAIGSMTFPVLMWLPLAWTDSLWQDVQLRSSTFLNQVFLPVFIEKGAPCLSASSLRRLVVAFWAIAPTGIKRNVSKAVLKKGLVVPLFSQSLFIGPPFAQINCRSHP